ncbi:MAG: isopeptide-forming domain-containing fimbrial protein [Clostridiales bacterium]|nr:isopeptide-forming domain-containing fimbrial protein [Clostridiales bacterium]
MSKLKKFACVLLALVLTMGLTCTAFAATSTNDAGKGSITIDNAVEGQTYTIYQLADVTYNTDTGAYTYTPTDVWSDFFETTDAQVYVTVTGQGYLTWNEGKNTAEDYSAFAKLAQQFAEDRSISNQGSETASSTGKVTFNHLALGWYLVDTSLGTLCSLDTTNSSVAILEKNDTTVVVKTVEEDSTGDYGDSNTAAIGQTVNFKATLTELKGSENVVLHDKMDDGLTYGAISSVIVYDGMGAEKQVLTLDDDYTVSTDSQDYTFELTIAQTVLDTLTDGDYIEVIYTATVNENAVIGSADGNENCAIVSYGEETTYSSESKTITYVYSFKLNKTDKDGAALSGAVFTLSENGTEIKFIYDGSGIYKVAADQTSTSASADITAGSITISGLDAGTYTLKETNAPDGYNLLTYDITVTIAEDGTVSFSNAETSEALDADEDDTFKLNVVNVAGTVLPTTGGIGTTIFYIIGGVLVLGAAVLLITKKRMNKA